MVFIWSCSGAMRRGRCREGTVGSSSASGAIAARPSASSPASMWPSDSSSSGTQLRSWRPPSSGCPSTLIEAAYCVDESQQPRRRCLQSGKQPVRIPGAWGRDRPPDLASTGSNQTAERGKPRCTPRKLAPAEDCELGGHSLEVCALQNWHRRASCRTASQLRGLRPRCRRR